MSNPIDDAFGITINSQAPKTLPKWATMPRFDSITPHDHQLCRAIGSRVAGMIADMAKRPDANIEPPHPTHCACLVAIAHLQFGMDLLRWFEAEQTDCLAEFMMLRQHATLREARIHPAVEPLLKFRKKGLSGIILLS